MDKIFETLRNSTNSYSKKINDSKYTQNIFVKEDKSSCKQYNSIYECLLSQKDAPYQILNDGENLIMLNNIF